MSSTLSSTLVRSSVSMGNCTPSGSSIATSPPAAFSCLEIDSSIDECSFWVCCRSSRLANIFIIRSICYSDRYLQNQVYTVTIILYIWTIRWPNKSSKHIVICIGILSSTVQDLNKTQMRNLQKQISKFCCQANHLRFTCDVGDIQIPQ